MTEQHNPTDHIIRVEIKDWLYNAGLVGLYRILKHADIPVRLRDNYLEFDSNALEGFEDMYFKYLYDNYEKDSLWRQLTTRFESALAGLDNTALGDEEKNAIEDFFKTFGGDLDKASNRSAYEIITGDANHMKSILKKVKDKQTQPEEKLEIARGIYNFFKEHKRIIQAKYVSYAVITHYWQNKSFLNKQQVKLDMYKLYKKDFVEPIFPFLDSPPKKKPFCNCFGCNRPINSKGDAATGLTWLNMDLDPARKTSLYWNYKPDIIVCPICSLVYSCVPAGFVTVKRKGIFINDNSNIDTLLDFNYLTKDRMETIEKIEEAENLSYFHIINLIRQSRDKDLPKELNNIQIIKNEGDRTYTFNMLSKHLLQVIQASEKALDFLSKRKGFPLEGYKSRSKNKHYIDLYQEVIRRLYLNISLYPLIQTLFHILMADGSNSFSIIETIFKININYIGGNMSDKKIYAMKKIGLELKKSYQKKEEKNKIPGIAYRLLNYLKTKNPNGFLDVVINCHMHIGKEIPTLFVEAIDNIDRFQAYGYSFLLGFTGADYNPAEKTDEQNAS